MADRLLQASSAPQPAPTTAQATAQQAPPAPPPPRKLRILALHGYAQTADTFRSRVGSLRKGLKSRAEFFFVDAPWEAGEAAGGGRSWWGWEGGAPGAPRTRPSQSSTPVVGWEASRKVVLDALAAHAPVDGLLGFSQGAAAAAWVLADLGRGEVALPPGVPPLRLAILAAGFVPGAPAAQAAFKAAGGGDGRGGGAPPSLLPTLLIAGSADETVPPARTEELAAVLGLEEGEGAAWLRHGGGHCVPTCSGGVKAEMVEWLDGVVVGGGG